MKTGATLIFVLASALLLAACANSASTVSIVPKPSTEAAANTIYINYEHDRFVPATASIPAGTTVIWQVSEDYAHHWVVCDAVPFRGWFYEWFPFKYIFTEPGTYLYYDGADPAVMGTITVY